MTTIVDSIILGPYADAPLDLAASPGCFGAVGRCGHVLPRARGVG